MVSEPTPAASLAAGELAALTTTVFVADAPPAVTLIVNVVVAGGVKKPSGRTEQPFVPRLPKVTDLGRAGVIDQVHAAVLGEAESWKPVGMPTTMLALAG